MLNSWTKNCKFDSHIELSLIGSLFIVDPSMMRLCDWSLRHLDKGTRFFGQGLQVWVPLLVKCWRSYQLCPQNNEYLTEWQLIVLVDVYFAFSTAQKATIHQVTTMLATSENVLFPGHNRLLITGTDDPAFWLLPWRQLYYDRIRNFLFVFTNILTLLTFYGGNEGAINNYWSCKYFHFIWY